MATFEQFYKSLPEDSNKRGELFEKEFVPWFLNTDPQWSSKIDEIWLWKDYPENWGRDCGIDLIFKDKQERYWAVQCKCVSPEYEITKAEIDSFLSESNNKNIYGRLLIASTDGIGANAQSCIDRQEKHVVCFLKEHFDNADVIYPSSIDDLSQGEKKSKKKPKDHQSEAIRKVVEGLKIADRGQLIMACGTGKTLTSLWIKEAIKAKKVLVLVPSLSLLSQTLREWISTSRADFNWICVCSDKTVAKKDRPVDALIQNPRSLGVPVTSDCKDIRAILSNTENSVVFSTYQSSHLIVEAQGDVDIPEFDIVFADEAHRCAGKVSDIYGCILDSKGIRSKKRLFMTATPRIATDQLKRSARTGDIAIASMDDKEKFGDVFYQLKFSKAISLGLLTPFRVVVVGVDDEEVLRKIEQRPLTTVGRDYETLAQHISVSKAIKDYQLKRVITFHSRVERAKTFSEIHSEVSDWLWPKSKSISSIKTGFVSGKLSARDRNKQISRLRNIGRGEIGILSNARCLSEGVDVPTLNGIAFIDPRRSQVDIIQAVGRAIRQDPSKDLGFIIIPVYIDDIEQVEKSILTSRFKDVWKIIIALSAQDDDLAESLDNLRIELGKRPEPRDKIMGLEKIILDYPESVDNKLGESLKTFLVRETTDNWNEMYGMYLKYLDEKRDEQNSKWEGYESLKVWISTQRTAYKNNLLSYKRIQLLEKAGFKWEIFDELWHVRYEELVEFKKEYNHTRVPKGYAKNKRLGKWVFTQRMWKKSGKLPADRQKLLDLIGFEWVIREAPDQRWFSMYEKLVKYRKDKGHANIPAVYAKDPALGSWCRSQRYAYKNKVLSNERIDLLRKIGFIFDANDAKWHEKYREYKDLFEYARKNKLARVMVSHSKNKALYKWCSRQREAKKDGSLSNERKELLEAVHFEWNLND